jgi:hypothetical protein
MFHHGSEDRQQLAHAGGQRHLLRFAGGTQPLIEGFGECVMKRAGKTDVLKRFPKFDDWVAARERDPKFKAELTRARLRCRFGLARDLT